MPTVNLVVFVSSTAIRGYGRTESISDEIITAVDNLNVALRQSMQSQVGVGLRGIFRLGFPEYERQTIDHVHQRFYRYWRAAVMRQHRALAWARRATRADLAILVVKSARMASGRAYVLSQPFREMARFGCAALTLDALVSPLHTLSHEIGHLFGCGHHDGEYLDSDPNELVGTLMQTGSRSRMKYFANRYDPPRGYRLLKATAQRVGRAAPDISLLSTRRS